MTASVEQRDHVPSTRQRLCRVWARALAACALYLFAALVIPRLIGGAGAQRDRPRRGETVEYVMPSGERRRVVVFTRADAPRPADRGGDRALLWWCGILTAVTVAGAVAQTRRIRADARRATE